MLPSQLLQTAPDGKTSSSVSQSTFREEKRSGFSGSLMGGISYGKSSQDQSQAQQQVIQVGSTVSGANVAIAAGRDATVSASAVLVGCRRNLTQLEQ